MTQGHCGEFHLLLLCLCHVFFSFTQEKPHVPPTHAAILSPLTLSAPSSRPWQMHLRLRKKKKSKRVHRPWQTHTDTHTGPNQPSVTNMLMTLHSNKSNDFQSQTSEGPSGAAIVAPPRNIQHRKQQTRDQWFIRVSAVVLARGWFTNTKHTARREETPPPSVEWCGAVDLIACARSLSWMSVAFSPNFRTWQREHSEASRRKVQHVDHKAPLQLKQSVSQTNILSNLC